MSLTLTCKNLDFDFNAYDYSFEDEYEITNEIEELKDNIKKEEDEIRALAISAPNTVAPKISKRSEEYESPFDWVRRRIDGCLWRLEDYRNRLNSLEIILQAYRNNSYEVY